MSFINNSGCFTYVCVKVYYGKCQNKYFWGNLKPAIDKLVSSTFNKKEYSPSYAIQSSYQGFIYSIVYIDENCRSAIVSSDISS